MRALRFYLLKIYHFQISEEIPRRDLILFLSAFLLGITFVKLQTMAPDSAKKETCLSMKLVESELAWRRNSEKVSLSEASIERGRFPNQIWFRPLKNGTVIWDYFVSSFDCPFGVERVGRVGDGGKWVCGLTELSKKNDCVVYSFGVRGDTSFEEEILARTQCRVHMFDPTGDPETLLVMDSYPERTSFSRLGISGSNTRGFHTLRTFMERNGDKFLDILKMDVEGAEWEVLEQVEVDFGGEFPFAQLQVEVHLSKFQAEDQFESTKKAWNSLEKAGLRPFRDEANLQIRSGIHLFHEYSFLNTKSLSSPFFVDRL